MEYPKPEGPVQPIKLGLDDSIRFQCHKGIACFNACCQNIDITLTPYDILRLKNHLGMSSEAFLKQYTVPFEMDAHGTPGLKLKTRNDSTACQFVTEEGCAVYQDRPTACRYYAMGQMSLHKKDSNNAEESYFIVKEEHCLGHQEPRTITVREYRQEQGLEEYDKLSWDWRETLLKKRSCGPTVGAPSERSFRFFSMASYNLDAFRRFISSDSFRDSYDIAPETLQGLIDDEIELLSFAQKFLKQVLFNEKFIHEKPDALQKRVASKRQRDAKMRELQDRMAQSGEPAA